MRSSVWWCTSSLVFLLLLDTFSSVHSLSLHIDPNGSPNPPRISSKLTEERIYHSGLVVHKRVLKDLYSLGPGWVGHIIYSEAIYPYLVGAQILGKFYREIMVRADSVWAPILQTNFYTISCGTISLVLWAEDSFARITWQFVYDLASRLSIATQLGFVGLFDASFVHLATGVMVHVKLTIRGKP